MIGPMGPAWSRSSEAIAKTLKRSKMARRITPARRLKIPFETFDLHTSDGVRLTAWYLPRPEDSEADPDLTVVLHHHYGGQKATLMPWIEFFHGLGLPMICFDARGHADSDAAPHGGGSFVRRAADFQAACDEARRRGAKRILGFGQSQGAAAMVISVARRDDVVGLILDSGPAPDMASAAWGLAGNMLGSEGSKNHLHRALLGLRILPGTQPTRYLCFLWLSLAKLRGMPLLWLHGGRDQVIAESWSSLWFRSLKPSSGKWSSFLVPTADHIRCLQAGGDELRAVTTDFIQRRYARSQGGADGF